VAADVCRALGITNPRDATAGLDADEKDVGITDTPGGQQEMTVISESGVYVLIFKSRKPTAIRFRKWITSVVIPSIRQSGVYIAPSVVSIRKPHTEWSLEETRVALAKVNTA
jgi:prophage antirepressor-like protein